MSASAGNSSSFPPFEYPNQLSSFPPSSSSSTDRGRRQMSHPRLRRLRTLYGKVLIPSEVGVEKHSNPSTPPSLFKWSFPHNFLPTFIFSSQKRLRLPHRNATEEGGRRVHLEWRGRGRERRRWRWGWGVVVVREWRRRRREGELLNKWDHHHGLLLLLDLPHLHDKQRAQVHLRDARRFGVGTTILNIKVIKFVLVKFAVDFLM